MNIKNVSRLANPIPFDAELLRVYKSAVFEFTGIGVYKSIPFEWGRISAVSFSMINENEFILRLKNCTL